MTMAYGMLAAFMIIVLALAVAFFMANEEMTDE